MKIKKQNLTTALLLIFFLTFAACSGNETSSNKASATESLSQVSSQQDRSINAETKKIKLTIVYDDDAETFDISTDANNLRAALEQEGLIKGDESEFGLFVTSVNGITADADKQEWWCLTKSGEMWNYGVDDTEISDGDVFEFTLTESY